MDGKCECFLFFPFLDFQYIFLVCKCCQSLPKVESEFYYRGLFRILILWVLSFNKIFIEHQQFFFLFYALVSHLKFYAEVISGGRSIFYLHLDGYTLWLRLNYYTQKIGGHRQHWILHKMNIRHPGQLKKLKFWGPFGKHQLNSTANLANLAHFLGKCAGLAVLPNWQFQNGPQDFDFLNCQG